MAHIGASDLQGISRLAITASTSVTDLVEAMHHTVNSPFGLAGGASRTRGITGLVYRGVRGVMQAVGQALELTIAPFAAAERAPASSAERDAVVAALNGVFGDHLRATDNPLAIEMSLRAPPPPLTGKVVVLVHGLCMSDGQWLRKGHDHGAALARDLGYTPLYLRYNSGLHISTNGRAFAELLERTLADWPLPIEELVIIGHSMGGLVARSACHVAEGLEHAWLPRLKKLFFLGTPHHGAPLERGGNWLNLVLGVAPYAAPFARLGHARSAGITDLRYGTLRDEEWRGRDRFAHRVDDRRPLPLPEGVRCFALAASQGQPGSSRGDGLVPLACALGRHERAEHDLGLPASDQWVGNGIDHLDLLDRPEVYARLKAWLEDR